MVRPSLDLQPACSRGEMRINILSIGWLKEGTFGQDNATCVIFGFFIKAVNNELKLVLYCLTLLSRMRRHWQKSHCDLRVI